MKKHKLLFLGAALAAMPFVASADDTFDPSQIQRYNRTNSMGHAWLTSFGLQEKDKPSTAVTYNVTNTYPSGSNLSIYYDRTGEPAFVTTAGTEIEFSNLVYNRNYMSGYLYIDRNGDDGFGDGGFNSNLYSGCLTVTDNTEQNKKFIEDALHPSEDGELFSFYTTKIDFTPEDQGGTDTYCNSKGEVVPTDQKGNKFSKIITGADMPTFTIPADMKPGRYNALFKMDWASTDQHGSTAIGQNGGAVVKFIIQIVAPRTITIASNNDTYGTVAFQGEDSSVDKKTFPAGEAAVVVATPKEGYAFANWTKDGEVVSTNAEYTVDIYDEEFTLTANFIKDFTIPTEGENIVWLDELEGLGKVTCLAGETVRQNQSTTGTAGIIIDGQPYAHGIGTHAPSVAYIKLNGATAFYSVFGIDATSTGAPTDHNYGNVRFIVTLYKGSLNNPKEVYGKHICGYKSDPDYLNGDKFNTLNEEINLADYDYMKLEVASNAANGNSWGNHADWADARFITDGTNRPVFLTASETEAFTPRVEWPTEGENTDAPIQLRWSFKDAAYHTIHYQPNQYVRDGRHTLQAVATFVSKSSETASDSPRKVAAMASDDTESTPGLILANNFKNLNEEDDLVFNLPSDATEANLNFAAGENYKPSTTYNYNVHLQTVDDEGNVISDNRSNAQAVSFTTTQAEGGTSGIVDIEEAATVAPRYYNLQGIEVAQPTSAGVYIVRQGNKVSKVYVK